MSIELGPVATLTPPPAKEASPMAASKPKKPTAEAKGAEATTLDDKTATDTSKPTEATPSGFLALLAQFAAPVADAPVAAPALATPASDAPLVAPGNGGDGGLPAVLSSQPPSQSSVKGGRGKRGDGGGDDLSKVDVAQSPPAMDAASLIAQMQVGVAGNSSAADKVQTSLTPSTPSADSEPVGSPKRKTASSLAGGAGGGDASINAAAGAGGGVGQLGGSGDAGDGGGNARGGKWGADTDKHGGSQHLQATLSSQNAAIRADKAEQALAQSSAGSAANNSPSTAIGETFRQFMEGAKRDKTAESTSLSAAPGGTELRQNTPAMAWESAFTTSKTIASSADISSANLGFGVEQASANPVAMWVSQNVRSAEITLDAQGQDPVQVSIQMSGNEAQVQLRSDVPETRELLTQAMSTLDSALQREGLSLSGVSVGTSLAGKDSSREPGQNGSSMGRLSRVNGATLEALAPAQRVHVGAAVQAALGRVDYFV